MKKEIGRILSEWTQGLNREQTVLRVFEKVRDIPYGTIGSRDPLKVYLMGSGTCSGKHFLLAAL